jgi:hypothetical protein
MAANTYTKLTNLVANSSLDWVNDDIRALLVSSSYAFDAAHAFVSEITGELTHGSYARKVLGSKSIVVVDADTDALYAAALTWTSLAGGVNPAKIILYKRVTNDADSPLLACLDVSGVADGSQNFNVTFGATDPGPTIELTTGAGIAGPPGASVLSGAGAPSSGLGVDGDHYFNETNCDWYDKSGGSWGSPVTNLKGLQGIQGTAGTNGTNGSNGTNGADGASLLTGAGAPNNGSGNNGDHYIDTTSWNFYNKSAGSWGSPVGNIKGATGDTGATGATGPAAIPGLITDSGTTRTLAASDFGKYIRFTSNSAVTVNVPAGLSISAVDTCLLHQAGTGQITVVPTGGTPPTVNKRLTLKTAGQHSTIALSCYAADAYDLSGDVATS